MPLRQSSARAFAASSGSVLPWRPSSWRLKSSATSWRSAPATAFFATKCITSSAGDTWLSAYVDQPPMVALQARLSEILFGYDHMWSLRLHLRARRRVQGVSHRSAGMGHGREQKGRCPRHAGRDYSGRLPRRRQLPFDEFLRAGLLDALCAGADSHRSGGRRCRIRSASSAIGGSCWA